VFKNITISKGDIATVDSKTNGGFTFQSHVNDPITFQKIHSKPWNFVVLQGQSQEPSFPYSQVNTSTLPYAVRLADSVYSNAPCINQNQEKVELFFNFSGVFLLSYEENGRNRFIKRMLKPF